MLLFGVTRFDVFRRILSIAKWPSMDVVDVFRKKNLVLLNTRLRVRGDVSHAGVFSLAAVTLSPAAENLQRLVDRGSTGLGCLQPAVLHHAFCNLPVVEEILATSQVYAKAKIRQEVCSCVFCLFCVFLKTVQKLCVAGDCQMLLSPGI